MNQFKKEGKIRYFGCSNWSAERIHEAMRYADDKKITGFTAHQTMKNVAYPNMPAVLYDGMTYISPELEQLHTNDQFPLFAYTAAARGYFHLQTGQTFKPHRCIDPVGNYLITISQGNDLPLLKSLPKKPAGILPKLFWHTFINYHILLCRLLVYSHCVILLIV